MDFKKLEPRLHIKEHELLSTLAALEGEVRDSGSPEVRDSADDATASQGTAESLEAAAALTHTLEEVRDALHRMEEGTYGKCVVCGKPIEHARLEAVPWTPYCLEDQEKEDLKAHPRTSVQWNKVPD